MKNDSGNAGNPANAFAIFWDKYMNTKNTALLMSLVLLELFTLKGKRTEIKAPSHTESQCRCWRRSGG
jgi:hypothetical protein